MFDASQFSIPKTNSIHIVGGIVVGDTEHPANQFIERFGSKFVRLEKDSEFFVLFDKKHDRICFMLNKEGGQETIQVYPNLTKAQWLESWNGDKEALYDSVSYYEVDPKYKHMYLQLLEILERSGCDEVDS